MQQIGGPVGPPKKSRTLKAARGLLILAALTSVFALWCFRIGLVSFSLVAVLLLGWGLYAGSTALVVVAAAALLLISRLPSRELARSVATSGRAASVFAKITYRLYTIAAALLLLIGLLRGEEGLIESGLFGLIPWAARRVLAWSSILNPYQDRHIAGTWLVDEREAIRRAEAIRYPGGR